MCSDSLPAFMLLAFYMGLTGFALGIKRVESLLQALLEDLRVYMAQWMRFIGQPPFSPGAGRKRPGRTTSSR